MWQLLFIISWLFAGVGQNEHFLMAIDEVYPVHGRGVMIKGTIERGGLRQWDSLEIQGVNPGRIMGRVRSIENQGQSVSSAKAGDKVALLLGGVERAVILRGMVAGKPRTLATTTEFTAEIQLKSKEDGGPFIISTEGFSPRLRIRNLDVSAELTLVGKDQVLPGEKGLVKVRLFDPVVLEKNQEFLIKDGGKIIGTGWVTGF